MMFADASAWERWLRRNGRTSQGVWLRIARKRTSLATVSYTDALEVALCYGWIDGRKRSLDEVSWLQRFTPRGPRSIWSAVNRNKALDLIRSGRMRKPGLAAVEAAKADGRWENAYDSWKQATVPPDLQEALRTRARARRFFDSLDSHNRYAILFRLHHAKRPETRLRRLEKFVTMLERHEKIYP